MNELRTLLQSYFHQDWVEEFESLDNVINYVVTSNDTQFVLNLKNQIEEILKSEKPELVAEDIISRNDCYYHWREGESKLRWLRGIYEKL